MRRSIRNSTSPRRGGTTPGYFNFWRLGCSNSRPPGPNSRSNVLQGPLREDKFQLQSITFHAFMTPSKNVLKLFWVHHSLTKASFCAWKTSDSQKPGKFRKTKTTTTNNNQKHRVPIKFPTPRARYMVKCRMGILKIRIDRRLSFLSIHALFYLHCLYLYVVAFVAFKRAFVIICLLHRPKAVDPTEFQEKIVRNLRKEIARTIFLSDWFCRPKNVSPNSVVVKACSFPVNSSVEKVLSQQRCFQEGHLIIRTTNGSLKTKCKLNVFLLACTHLVKCKTKSIVMPKFLKLEFKGVTRIVITGSSLNL